MTNREWLETLTDEEFAKWNYEIGCGSCAYNPEKGICERISNLSCLYPNPCMDGIAKWLQQEHKENMNDGR